MTTPPIPATGFPLVQLSRPRGLEGQISQLIELIAKIVPSSAIEQVDTSLSPQSSESIIEIDVSSTRTDLQVPLALASRKLTFLSWPPTLQQLDVKLNRQTSQVFDVLTEGNRLQRSNGISEIFVTTAPAIPGGKVRVLVGDLDIFPRVSRFGCLNICDLPFRIVSGEQTSLDVGAQEPLKGPTRFTVQHDRTSSIDLITNIPKSTLFRIYGRITSEDETTTAAKVDAGVRLKKGASEMWQDEFDGMIGGPQTWLFDTGWGFVDDQDDFTFHLFINSIGPAGNVLSISLTADFIPNQL